MTCIVGCVDERTGTVFMGGDSCAMNQDYEITIVTQPKVVRNGEFLFGFAGDFRWGQLLSYVTLPRCKANCKELERFLAVDFAGRLRDTAIDIGAAYDDHGMQIIDGCCLFGFRGRLFKLQNNFSALEVAGGVAAVGTGGMAALGAMLASPDVDAETRILNALSISARCCGGVCPPFTILTLEKHDTSRTSKSSAVRHPRGHRKSARRTTRKHRTRSHH